MGCTHLEPRGRTDELTPKQEWDIRNAYAIICNKITGHPTEHKVSLITVGDARAAWRQVNKYFIKQSSLGKSAAIDRFWKASMQNTGLTVVPWGEAVHQRGEDVTQTGGTITANDKALVYLNGLLPPFDPIRDALQTTEPPIPEGDTLYDVYKEKVEDWASAKGHLETSSGGSNSTKNRTFTVDGTRKIPANVDQNELCRMWSSFKCRFGDGCWRRHDGPGGCIPWEPKSRSAQQPAKPAKQQKVVCQFCQETGHALASCDKFSTRSSSGQAPNSGQAPTSGQARPQFSSSNFVDLPASAQQSRPHASSTNFIGEEPAFNFSVEAEPLMTEGASWEDTPDTDAYNYGAYLIAATISLLLLLLSTGFGWVTSITSYFTSERPVYTTVCTFVAIMAAAGAYAGHPIGSPQPHSWGRPRLILLFIIVCAYAFGVTAMDGPPSEIDPNTYNANGTFAGANCFFGAQMNKDVSVQYEWCADCGTNRFVTNDINDFVPGSIRREQTTVAVGGGTVISPCTGTVMVRSLDYGHIINCSDVLYLPKCAKKLMPASQFTRKGCTMTLKGDGVHLLDKTKGPILSGKEFDGLFYYHSQTVKSSSLNTAKSQVHNPIPSKSLFFGLQVGKSISAKSQDFAQQLYEAHISLGHLHFSKVRKLLGLKPSNDNPECPACTIAMQKQHPLSDHSHTRSTRPCHRMWMDLGFTAGSKFKFQLYVDDYTRESFIDVIDGKEEVLQCWVTLKNHLENDYQPWKFAFIKTDCESIYWTPQWDQHCTDNGIVHEFSSRYRHDQLGVVERAMQSIGVPFRAMMITGNAPEKHIPHALRFANVIRNNSPTTANKGLTPLEKKAGKKLPLNRRLMRAPLFCLCFAQVYADERAKHGRRGIACVYLGYDPVNNTYLVMEWDSQKEYYTADVEFFPNVFPYRANLRHVIGGINQFDDLAPHATDLIPEQENSAIRESARQRGYRFSGGVPIEGIPDVDVAPDPVDQAVYFTVHNWGPEPTCWEEAMNMHDAEQWILADLIEREQFKSLNVYDVVLRCQATSRGKRIFKYKEVFKRKMNPPDEDNPFGSLDKHKMRLTIAAYTKTLKEGIDYQEKNASTVRWTAIKALLAIAVKIGHDITLIDIATFFLYGDLEEEVYMEFPSRWAENGKTPPEYIWLLKKGVYGWPAASNGAQKKLKAVLIKEGKFKPVTSDDCIYVSTNLSKGFCAIGTHVDDLFVIGDAEGRQELIKTLEGTFKIKVVENPTSVTGVELVRNIEKKWAKLHQRDYTTKMLEEFKMENSHPVDTPIDASTAKVVMTLPTDEHTPESIKLFQTLLGMLMWLCCRTRPDLTFVINLFSRFVRCASTKHYNYLRDRPLRYLNGTRDHGLVFFPGEGEWNLIGSSDADLAGDLSTSRSTLSFHTRIGQYGNLHSSSSLERKICTSTGQAETYAFHNLLKEIIWERNLLRELGFPQEGPTPCYCDNDGVIIQSTKMVNHAAAKHYRIAQAFIRQICSDGIAKALAIDTSNNPSDIGTKALAVLPFQRHRLSIMGPQDMPA